MLELMRLARNAVARVGLSILLSDSDPWVWYLLMLKFHVLFVMVMAIEELTVSITKIED